MRGHIAIGSLALLTWFVLFAAGASIDSSPYRSKLAPPNGASLAASGSGLTAAGVLPAPAEVVPALDKLAAFLAVVTLYTPLNVALLTIFAGLIGGCASRLTFVRPDKMDASQTDDERSRLSDTFRSETPVASMLRSFLVYLAFIAGIFITTNDPFASPTPDQYVRIAGLLSFVSFVVGYDPTRFQDILALRPGGRGR